MWCENPHKVPRKFIPKAVHGAAIRSGSPGAVKPGADNAQGGEKGSGGDEDAEATRDAAKVYSPIYSACFVHLSSLPPGANVLYSHFRLLLLPLVLALCLNCEIGRPGWSGRPQPQSLRFLEGVRTTPTTDQIL